MAAQNAAHLPAYLECIEHNPKELDALFRDIMITVTTFYRDPDSFDALKSALKPMLERKSGLAASESGARLRDWGRGILSRDPARRGLRWN